VNDSNKIVLIILSSVAIGLILIPSFASPWDNQIIENRISSGSSNFTDTTVCFNVGNGKLIVRDSTNGDCNIKSLVGSSDISITNTTNTIVIDFNGTISGESTQCVNVGSGKVVIKNSTSGNCYVKSFLAGSGLSVTNATDTITYTNTLPENTVCTNAGSSSSLSEGVCIDNLVTLKRLLEGTAIALSSNSTHITITNTAPESTVCTNLGIGGEGFYVSGNCNFKKLTNKLCSGGVRDGGLRISSNSTHVGICQNTGSSNTQGQVYGQSIKTNIGTTYVDIYTTTFSQEDYVQVDCNGGTDTQLAFRINFLWDYIGTGSQSVRWVEVINNANVLTTVTGITTDQDAGQSNIFTAPSWCTGQHFIEMQGLSTVATDDPVAWGYTIKSGY
jgi:hypothetical protein